MTDNELTQALERDLHRGLAAVPLPAPNPSQARYRALGAGVGGRTRRTVAAGGAIAFALLTSVVVAAAAPGGPAWAAEAERLVTSFVMGGENPPAASGHAPARVDEPKAGSVPATPAPPAPAQVGAGAGIEGDGSAAAVETDVEDRLAREADAEVDGRDPEVGEPIEKEKTSDFRVDRSSSVKP